MPRLWGGGWAALNRQTDFRIIVYSQTHEYFKEGTRDATGDDSMVCNKGCDWRALGDGHCNPQCNNTACFWDRLDCEHDDGDPNPKP